MDGARVGKTPLRNHKLPVGSHTVELRDPATGHATVHAASITKGRPTMIKGTTP